MYQHFSSPLKKAAISHAACFPYLCIPSLISRATQLSAPPVVTDETDFSIPSAMHNPQTLRLPRNWLPLLPVFSRNATEKKSRDLSVFR